jgi:thiol-disulfide isomerase/thioredoxin
MVGLTVVALLFIFAFNDDAETASDDGSDRVAAPEVVLEDFEGNAVTISSLQGQPAVVNFWASWCIPCLAELPGFEGVYQTYGDSVQFLGINLADDPASAQYVVADTGITYPLARDPEGEAFTAFGALGMPTTVFLDAEGRVVELYTGELTAGELEAKIVDYFES